MLCHGDFRALSQPAWKMSALVLDSKEILSLSSSLTLGIALFIDPGSGPDLQVLFRTGHPISQGGLE